MSPDHPRSRGVDQGETGARPDGGGSSPLARGRQRQGCQGVPRVRIIPARAGSTSGVSEASVMAVDHPRSRGVDPPWPPTSPTWRWIIPARAGSTPSRKGTYRHPADHPRSRGVDSDTSRRHALRHGSSSLARGRLAQLRYPGQLGGIIPARAGSTWCPARGKCAALDHPRSRGVDYELFTEFNGFDGSSPLARGRPLVHVDAEPAGRIIPARAGSTSGNSGIAGTSGDHPRSRGVDGSPPWGRTRAKRIIPARAGSTALRPRFSVSWLGSSPLARGRLFPSLFLAVFTGSSPLARGRRMGPALTVIAPRIIPARAGSTSPPGAPRHWTGDHPRSRGVDALVYVWNHSETGSSPLARGRRFPCPQHPRPARIIPARAGSTAGL